MAQKKIHYCQIPLLTMGGEPVLALVLGLSDPYRLYGRQLFERPDQVLSNGGVVFNDIGAEFHRRVPFHYQRTFTLVEPQI